MAIDAGVVAPAEPVGRLIKQRIEFFGEIHLDEGQVKVRRGLPGPLGPVKRGDEADEGDVNPLGPEDRPGQHAVQTPGQEAQSSDFSRHS